MILEAFRRLKQVGILGMNMERGLHHALQSAILFPLVDDKVLTKSLRNLSNPDSGSLLRVHR
jgi:hypothetical protein